jgi:16S rRNA (cytidine1402-2'-O)-methyltransferase
MAGTLFLVATPIGNLADITYRAVRVLSEVALIACEDTRHTARLLSHLGLSTPTISYHEHNEQSRAKDLVARLEAGADIALVSDAGTPLVSDPGYRLLQAAIRNSINVVSVPGPSAAIAALTVSGFPIDRFLFIGFVPQKAAQRRQFLVDLLHQYSITIVLYEAPHRLLDTLSDLAHVYGPDHLISVSRELTKVHEETLRGPIFAIQSQFAARPSIKGEFTIVLGPRTKALEVPATTDLRQEVESLIGSGVPRMDAIKEVARKHGLPKRDVYRIIG